MIGLALVTRVWRRLMVGDGTPLDTLLETGFVAVDLETTGLDVQRDAIVAVAAVPFESGRPRPGLVTLVNPGRPIPPSSTAIHGIDDAAVAGAPSIREVLPRFDGVCVGRVVVGHDVGFDFAMLARARTAPAGLAPRVVFDTRRLARVVRFTDSRLEVVAGRLGVSDSGRHTAEGDARMTGEILLALLPALRSRGARTFGDLVRIQRSAALHD